MKLNFPPSYPLSRRERVRACPGLGPGERVPCKIERRREPRHPYDLDKPYPAGYFPPR